MRGCGPNLVCRFGGCARTAAGAVDDVERACAARRDGDVLDALGNPGAVSLTRAIWHYNGTGARRAVRAGAVWIHLGRGDGAHFKEDVARNVRCAVDLERPVARVAQGDGVPHGDAGVAIAKVDRRAAHDLEMLVAAGRGDHRMDAVV